MGSLSLTIRQARKLRDKGIKGTVSPYTTLEVDGADANFHQTAYIPDGGVYACVDFLRTAYIPEGGVYTCVTLRGVKGVQISRLRS